MIQAADFLKWVKVFKLISSGGPVPPVYVPPGGVFTPSFTLVQGISSVSLTAAKYSGNANAVGGIITAAVNFNVTADSSNALMSLRITLPIAGNFTDTRQAEVLGFTIIKTSNTGVAGAIGDGWFNGLYAQPPNEVILNFEGAQPSVSYRVNVSWAYEIQALLEENENA